MNLNTKSLLGRSLEIQRQRLAEFAREKGVGSGAKIPADKTFRQWCEDLGEAGLKVDGFPFTLADRPAMHFIYDLIPTTIEEARGQTVVMMKCAQVGFTVMEMLAGIYLALKFSPLKIGMYLPDMKLAAAKSSERFMPIVRTVPAAYERLLGNGGTEGNVMIRNMGESRFHFLWTSGKAMTESFPMDVISFDEVQGMTIESMEKTRERLSASRVKFTLMGSTALWPDRDIHHWFKKGKQYQFHTRCPHCAGTVILDEEFPRCIGYDEAVEDYRYTCKHCQGWIDDPQQGEWIAADPAAKIRSIHFPQFLSPTITPREIIEAYYNADDLMNFYNRKLGKPYTDPSQVPVNLEMLNACAADGMAAGLKWKASAENTYMGIDQMGQFNVAIIKERLPSGRQGTVHLEYIYDPDPFKRCDELMDQYGVQVCVVESLPNYNDAKRFAQRHRGKVFTVATYRELKDSMIEWSDGPEDRSERRTSEEAQDRYTVTLDQYKCMQTSMARFQRKVCLFPDPQALTQEIVEKGIRKTVAVLKDMAFLHFTRTALIAEKDPEQKKFRRKVVKVGIDPHTSYANMLCDVAWARAHGTASFILPDGAGAAPVTPIARNVEKAMPGLPATVIAMMDDLPMGVCGRCQAFKDGMCVERELAVGPRDKSCDMFTAIEAVPL